MAIEKLIWVGLACCLTGLGIQMFPNAAFNIGVDVNAAWLLFGFGVFLILISAAVALTAGSHNCSAEDRRGRGPF